jgi:hypothetical protein
MPNNDCLTSRDNIQFGKCRPHIGTQDLPQPLWVITWSRLLVSPTSIANDWLIKVVALATFKREKFTQSCRCESPSDLGGRSTLHLVNPNTSRLSKCGILVERPKLEVYLATTTTIWNGSPDWLALHMRNSFLSRSILDAHPCKKNNTMKTTWMFACNHWTL